jgi:hypothetical protein
MASIEAWLHQHRQNAAGDSDDDDDRTPPAVDFAPTLRDYLLGRTSAEDTAEKISSLLAEHVAAACAASAAAANKKKDDEIADKDIAENGDEDDDGDFDEGDADDDGIGDDLEAALWDLWGFINDTAKQVPDVHDALLDLLAALRQLPDVKRDDGELLHVWDMVLWRDLLIWGADVREKYNCKKYSCSQPIRPLSCLYHHMKILENHVFTFMAVSHPAFLPLGRQHVRRLFSLLNVTIFCLCNLPPSHLKHAAAMDP